MEQLVSCGPWEDLWDRKQGEKCFLLSLSDTSLLRLPGWYKIINTVTTHAVLKGVAQQKMRSGHFPSRAFALLLRPWQMVCRGIT